MTEFHRCDFCGREGMACHDWMKMTWHCSSYEACPDCAKEIFKHNAPNKKWKTVGEE